MSKVVNKDAISIFNIKHDIYISIKNELQTNWPSWKKEAYNENFATTNNVKKLVLK